MTLPTNPETELQVSRRRAWEFWRRNQLIFLHLPVLLAALIGGYIVLKAVDKNIGVEGFGDLFGYAKNGVRAALILFTAWWIKKWCWFDLHTKTELALFEASRAGDRNAFWLVTRDRAEWAAALAFATYWYTL